MSDDLPGAVLQRMVELVDPAWTVREATLAERGFCRVYRLLLETPRRTRTVYLKAAPDGGDAGVAADARVLAVLREHTSVPVPEVLAVGEDYYVARWHPDAPAPDEDGYFGYSAVGVGDADGAGTPGLVLGTRVSVPDAEPTGRAHLMSADGDPLRTFADLKIGTDARFGSVVSSISDPGDSSATAVLVGAPQAKVEKRLKAGRVYRFALP